MPRIYRHPQGLLMLYTWPEAQAMLALFSAIGDEGEGTSEPPDLLQLLGQAEVWPLPDGEHLADGEIHLVNAEELPAGMLPTEVLSAPPPPGSVACPACSFPVPIPSEGDSHA